MPLRLGYGPILRRLSRPLLRLPMLALLAWAALPPATPAQMDGQTIADVQIEGLATYSVDQMRAGLQTQAGRPFRPLEVRRDLEQLARVMQTATVNVEPTADGEVVVRFRVVEFPRLRQLDVIGNQRLDRARIEGVLRMQPGDTVLSSNAVESARRALVAAYAAEGMPQTAVQMNLIGVEEETDTGARPYADLQIIIDEGDRILCDDLIIRGNRAFSTVRLRRLIETSGSFLFLRNHYDDVQFEEDLARLQDFYAARGYFDARIRRGRFEARNDGSRTVVSPVIEIDEGERYQFGDVEIRGARLYSHAELRAPFENLRGRPFDGEMFTEARAAVQKLHVEHGLLTTDIEPDLQYRRDEKSVDLVLNITERNRIYVGRVQLEKPRYADDDEPSRFRRWYGGFAPPVKDEVILREVLLEPGEIYNRSLERDSLRRLARLGVFDSESLEIRPKPTQDPDIYDAVVSVEETVTGRIGGGVGYGDMFGAYVYGTFNERNVGGEADVLRATVQVGTRIAGGSISYLNRYLGDTRDSLASRLFYEYQMRPGYRARVGGAHTEWGHPLRGDWTSYLRGRFEVVELDERRHIDAHEDLDRLYAVATVRLRFEEDTRDYAGGPYRVGYVQSFGVEAGYADGPLVKFEASRDQYQSLTRRLTWHWYAEAGMMPYDRDVVPIHERYFLGGSSDLRGFDYRGAGYFDRDEDDLPIGGAARALLRNELIFPIYEPIVGVVFADVGSLGRSPVEWQAPRASTGVGLRFDMRQVQVGLDLAAPIVRQSDDETRFFHFSVQSQF